MKGFAMTIEQTPSALPEIGPVPDDFPPSVAIPAALSGAQPKFSMVKGNDGRYYQPGTEPGHRESRYVECLGEIEWSVDLLMQKLRKPKYQALTLSDILRMLRVNLLTDRYLSEPEADWVLVRVGQRLEAAALAARATGATAAEEPWKKAKAVRLSELKPPASAQ